MFLLEFMCATLAFTFRETLSYTFREELKYGIEMHYVASDDNSLYILWNKIQKEFRCCGVTDYEDWYVLFLNVQKKKNRKLILYKITKTNLSLFD